MHIVYIGLGSNMGDKAGNIYKALEKVGELPGTRIMAVSSFYKTEPVGDVRQDWFINAAAKIETRLAPRELLETLLSIERELGRVREIKWGPRVIDLDILLYDDLVVNEEGLIIPHPFLHERGFVLSPLAEIGAEVVHPVIGKRIEELFARLHDGKKVERAEVER